MSLRLKLIALFTAILAATMVVAALLGGPIAQRTMETEIRERTLKTGDELAAEIKLSAQFNAAAATQRLSELVRGDHGLRAAELGVELPGPDLVIRVWLTEDGVQTQERDDPAEVPAKTEATLVESPTGRFWSVSLPAKFGRNRARITLESSLAEADQLVRREAGVFFWVTAAACLFLVLVANLLLGRLISRPIEQLVQVMGEVERGKLDASAEVRGEDEISRLGRGFNDMLDRLRGFSAELTTKVNEAVADVARKNRDLAELNGLLVATRADLTAKERLAALGQLSGTLAHELGNPLNVISGNLQLLIREPKLTEETRTELRQLQDEVGRMTGIIRRFLDSTRGFKPALARVELGHLIAEALGVSLSIEVRSRLEVLTQVEPGLGEVELDPDLVRHVLTNLITNAVDAMPEGGKLTVGARRDGRSLALFVADSGVGISADERRRIFEPFFTTKPQGKGTGLGLSICREIALALKGHIDVESEVGHGSVFTLQIPFPVSLPPRAAELQPSPPA